MNKKEFPKFTGERVIEGYTPLRVWLDHVARYNFAGRYVKGKIVLDISCGTGYGSCILYSNRAKKVIGIDISKKVINFARTKYERKGLEFNIGNILNIDIHDNYFDLIVSFETIEHITNQKRALLEIQRVLKPNGLLLISSPNRKLTSPLKSFDEPPNNPFHVIEYTMKEFTRLIRNYFEIIEVYGQRGINKFFLFPLIERILRKILPWLYNPKKGSSNLEKVISKKEYRYIVVVCKKLIGGN